MWDAEFLLLGDGVALPALHARWGDHPRVRFGPFLPASQARTLIADADVGIVSLRPGMHRVAYPSKVMTYLEAGVPVLAAVDPGSDLAGMIEREGLGAASGDRSPEAIAAAVERLLDAPPSRTHIRNWHEATLSRELRLAQWSELVAEISAT